MFRKSFKAKIIIPTFFVLAALVIVLNIFLSGRFSALSDSLINEKLDAITNSLKLYLSENRANTKVAAVSMARNADVIRGIEDRDPEALLNVLSTMNDMYRIDNYIICDRDGSVLARTNSPDNYGDSVRDQQNVIDALAGKTSSYYETGTVIKVSIRSGAPVYDERGALIGVVSAGVRFDSDGAVKNLKRLFNSEVTVFYGDTRVATTIVTDGQSAVGTKMDPNIAKTVIENKEEYYGDISIFNKPYKAFYMPLLNSRGEAFATFFVGIPESDIITSSKASIRDGLLLGLLGLVISMVLLFFIISTISKPISKLSSDMNHIANGDLDIIIAVDGDDEVGALGKSLKKVAGILHKLLEDINNMIVEHEKGNTDYFFDPEEFLGDYRKLADSVLELADFGMRDQMTGLPNRRSFDNRLRMEWNRAAREGTSLSILIADVDKFKNYNDTFGHQQGDVALQTVAKAIKKSVMRPFDFTARWGGEEFVILLPAIDSNGAASVAEKIRVSIMNAAIPAGDSAATKVTVSLGVNTLRPLPGNSVESFIAGADEALYRAKEEGRNRFAVAPPGD